MASVSMRIPRQRRWPAILIAVLVVLAVLFTVASQFYIDLLWYREVDLASVFWTTLRSKVLLGLAFGDRVLPAALREPRDRPAHEARDPDPHPRPGDRRADPPAVRADAAVAAPARVRAARALRRDRRVPAVADVPALEEQLRHRLREPRAALRARPVVLRVLAAVAEVRAGVALLDPRGRDVPGGARALPLGRDPAAGAAARGQGDAGRPRPPLGAARADHAGEGLGLLPRAVRPPGRPRAAWCRARPTRT